MRGIICFAVALFCLFPLVSSAILINDNLDETYNVGDKVLLNFSVSSSSQESGFLDSYLVCDGDSNLIDKRYIFLNNQKKNFTLEFLLDETGACKFKIDFLENKEYSEEFEVSKELFIKYELNNKFFFPGEFLIVTGNVTKANGDKYSGDLDFKINDLVDKTIEIKDGIFKYEYEITSNSIPKEYSLSLEVKELDSSKDVINSGKKTDSIRIKSKPSSIQLIANSEVQPPVNSSFQVKLLDQVGNVMTNETILVKLFSPVAKNLLMQKEVKSLENFTYEFNGISEPGSYSLNAYYGSIFSSIPIYVKDYKAMEIGFNNLNNNLEIKNIGNIPYEGIVNFTLNNDTTNETIFFNVSLGFNQTESYPLNNKQYSGTYNLSAGGKQFSGIYLTGAAIGLPSDIDSFKYAVPIAFFIFLSWLYFFIRKRMRKNFREPKISEHEERYSLPKLISKSEPEIKVRKVSMPEGKLTEESTESSPMKKVFMVLLQSNGPINDYSSIVSNYGFTLNNVNANLGYVLFYGDNNPSPEYKIYNLANALKKFSGVRNDALTIVLNRGIFEKKINLLKKFSLFNKKLADLFPGKLIISDKVMEKLQLKIVPEEKIVDVMDRKIKVHIL